MHLFLRIQTLAQILGYRLFSLTHSNICLMARPEDLVLYKVMPTRDIVKCSSINMTNARLISNRKHKLPSQHKFSALSCRRADRVDSGRRLHSRRPPCHLTPRTVREKHGEDTGRQWMQRSQRWWWKRDKRRFLCGRGRGAVGLESNIFHCCSAAFRTPVSLALLSSGN